MATSRGGARRLEAALLLCLGLALATLPSEAQFTFGQATWYDSIDRGYCGFGSDLPANGFVAAWPFIETGPGGVGFWQPGAGPDACGRCFEVSCVPQDVESADGSIYLDRRSACADANKAVVVRVVDECRCSRPLEAASPAGNFNWCCGTRTPKLGIERHIDLSKQAFAALVRGGDTGLGIIGLRWRPAPCSRIGVVSLDGSAPPSPANTSGGAAGPQPAPQFPTPGSEGYSHWSLPMTDHTDDAANPQVGGSSGPAQLLAANAQCGGAGGRCAEFGSGACADAPFPRAACRQGLTCTRQNTWFWGCLDANAVRTLRASDWASKPAPTATCPRWAGLGQQCGGEGGACKTALPDGACADRPAAGLCCEPGLACTRVDRYFWGCNEKA